MSFPKFELISFLMCPYVRRARIVLLEKGIEHDVKYLDPSDLPPWFHDVSPMGKVPVLLVDKEPLFESMAIIEYLDEITPGSLHPSDVFEKAKNRSWIEFGNDLLSTTFDLIRTDDKKAYKKATASLDEHFDILEEDVLGEGPFFNGDKFSIVDAVYAPIFHFHQAIQKIEDLGFFDDRPLLTTWCEHLLEYPSVRNSVPETFEERLEGWLHGQDSILSAKM